MNRISTGMPFSNMEFNLRRHEQNLNNASAKIGAETRLNQLRDDPIAASHAVRYESFINRLNRFEKNTQYAMEHFDNTYDYLNSVNEIVQRVR